MDKTIRYNPVENIITYYHNNNPMKSVQMLVKGDAAILMEMVRAEYDGYTLVM